MTPDNDDSSGNVYHGLRETVTPPDRQVVADILLSTGVFFDSEIAIGVELLDERLAKGPSSGYHFVFAIQDGREVGYACYGPIPLTRGSYDLYWVAVCKEAQQQGLARRLLRAVEQRIAEAGGRIVYIETSSRTPYAAARAFYRRCGYEQVAVLRDFYAPGDDKVIFAKGVDRPAT